MATLNLVLDTRRARKDGTYPLVIRIRLDKKFKDIALGYYVQKKNFDLRTNTIIKDKVSNEQIEELRNHYYSRLKAYLTANIGREDLSDIRNYLVNKLPEEITIAEFWEEHITNLKSIGRNGGARVYMTSLAVLSKEMNLNVPFHKLSYKDLLEIETKLYQRGMSANGIGVYMRSFRAICNKAINLDIVSVDWYPFRKYKIKKTKTTPRVLKIEEVHNYFNLEVEPSHTLYKSWLIGKLIFLLRGINLKDLLLLSSDNIRGSRIIYKRAKTGKIYSVKMMDEVVQILKEFTPNKTLLGILSDNDLKDKEKLVTTYIQKRKVVNEHLNKLGIILETSEPISTYVFRYSYANIAKQIGYSKDLIAEALGHEYGNSVTGIYLEMYDLDLVDDMNEMIYKSVK